MVSRENACLNPHKAIYAMHVYANTLMLKLRRTRTCVFCYVAYRRPMSLSYNAEAHGAFPFWDNTGTSTRRSPRSARATVHTSAWVRMRAEMHTLVNHHIAMSMCAEATLTSFFPVRFLFLLSPLNARIVFNLIIVGLHWLLLR